MTNHVPGMIKYANQTVDCFGFDNTGTVTYQFNQQGFRSLIDFTQTPDYAFFGCSLVFGIGVAHESVFANKFTDSHNYGLAGCYTNHDIFDTIKSFEALDNNCVKKFVCWTDRNSESLGIYSKILADKNFIQFFCGPVEPYANCYPMLSNLDQDASQTHMGIKTHQTMYNVLCCLFDQ